MIVDGGRSRQVSLLLNFFTQDEILFLFWGNLFELCHLLNSLLATNTLVPCV